MSRTKLGYIIIASGLLLILPFVTSAKPEELTIKGTVKDSLQHTPLAYANIVVLSENSTTCISGTITNEYGDFRVKNGEVQRGILKVSLVGYQTKLIPFRAVGKEVNLETIALAPTATKIGTVVVKGTKPTIKLKGDVLVFDAKSVPMTSGDSGTDLLRLTPMVFVDPKGEILVKNKLATVLINGRKLPESQVYSYINSLKAEDIQSIKVQTSTALENDASIEAGTINIITKEIKNGCKVTARTTASYIERDSHSQNSSVSFNYGSQSWQLYGSYNYNSGNGRWHYKDSYTINEYINIDKIVQKRSDGFSYPRGDNFRVGTITDLAKNHTVGVELSGKNTFPLQSRSTSRATYYNHQWNVSDVGESQKKVRDRTDLYDASAYYTWKIDTLGSQLQVLADLVFHKNNNESFIESAYQNNPANNYAEQSSTSAKTKNGTFQVDFVKHYLSKLELQAGTKYTITNRNSSYSIFPKRDPESTYDVDEDIIALYAAASKPLTTKTMVRLGCRVEVANQSGANSQGAQHERIKSSTKDLFPNLTFSYEIDKNSTLAISYSRSIKRMPFLLLSTFTVRNSDYEYSVGNPHLKPVLTDKIELRYQYKNHYITPYLYYSPDMVTQCWNVRDGFIYQNNENRGAALYAGVDYGFNGKVCQWWSLNWSSDLYYTHLSQGFARKTYITAAVSASNRFSLTPNSSLDLTIFYRSNMIEATKLVKGQSFGSITYNHQFLKKRLNVGVSVTDIFQTQRQHVLINTPDLNTTIYQKQPSRSISASLSYVFSSKKAVNNRSKSGSNDIIYRL